MSKNHNLNSSDKWHKRFMDVAENISTWSKDRSTKVGSVIVKDRIILATGYNGFPRGLNDDIDVRHERPVKYLWMEHAERNAIYSAAMNGVSVCNSSIYVPWLPCVDCTRGIIQSGIKEIISKELEKDDPKSIRWAESHAVSLEMIKEANIKLLYLKD